MKKTILLLTLTLLLTSIVSSYDYTQNLLASYSFDNNDTTGSTSLSNTGMYNGTITGATTGSDGLLGESYSYDGADDKTTFGYYEFDKEPYCLSLWYNTTTSGGYYALFGNQMNSGSQYIQIFSDVNSGGKPYAQFCGDGGCDVTTNDSGYSDGAWHHIVHYRNGTHATLYIDGNLKSVVTDNQRNVSGTTAEYTLGVRADNNGDDYTGMIDQMDVWNASCTPEQVTFLYNSGNGRTYSELSNETTPPTPPYSQPICDEYNYTCGLLGLYYMNETGSTDDAIDYSGNNYDLSVTGGTISATDFGRRGDESGGNYSKFYAYYDTLNKTIGNYTEYFEIRVEDPYSTTILYFRNTTEADRLYIEYRGGGFGSPLLEGHSQNDNGTSYCRNSGLLLNTSQEYKILSTYDIGTGITRMFIDGNEITCLSNLTSSGLMNSMSEFEFYMGNHSIRNVAIWERSLSDQEIANLSEFFPECFSDTDCGFCEKCSANTCTFQSVEDTKDECPSSFNYCLNDYTLLGDLGVCNGAGSCGTNDTTSQVNPGDVCLSGVSSSPTNTTYCELWNECIQSQTTADIYYTGYAGDNTTTCTSTGWVSSGLTYTTPSGEVITTTENASTCQTEYQSAYTNQYSTSDAGPAIIDLVVGLFVGLAAFALVIGLGLGLSKITENFKFLKMKK